MNAFNCRLHLWITDEFTRYTVQTAVNYVCGYKLLFHIFPSTVTYCQYSIDFKDTEEAFAPPVYLFPIKLSFHPEVIFLSAQQGQNTLVRLVCLCQHCLASLCKDIVVGILNHLGRHVGIADSRLCGLRILNDIVKVVDGVL